MIKNSDIYKKIQIVFTDKDRKTAFWLFLGMVLLGGFEVAGVMSIAPFMAVVSNPQIIEENHYLNLAYKFGEFNSHSEFAIFLGLAMLCILVLTNAFTAFMEWQITYFVRRQGFRLEMRLLNYYLHQPYVFFLNKGLSEIGKNLLTEVDRIASGIVHPGLEIISRIIVILFIFLLLVFVNPMVAFVVFIVLGGSYIFLYLLMKNKQEKIGKLTTNAIHERYKLVNQIISGIKEIKLRNIEDDYAERYYMPASSNADYLAKNHVVSSLPKYALETVAFGGIIFVIVLLISQGNSGEEIIPLMALYVFAGYRLLPSFQHVYSSLTKFKFSLPVLNIVAGDLSKKVTRRLNKKKDKIEVKEGFDFRSVNYAYPQSNKLAINQLSLKINSNTTVGIVGSSGAGKTTLIDLLLGLLPIESGSFHVDGVEITPENIQSWRNNVGYIPQRVYLSDETIANNIAFGVENGNYDLQKITESGNMAMLDQFVDDLPNGYETMIGDRGIRISGGQIQRIGIARALYSNPSVLVMDEATSALDGITENTVMEAINSLSHKKTIIMIAHRISTVKQCDVIHVMDKGEIVDSGTYESLLKNNVQFRMMAKVQ